MRVEPYRVVVLVNVVLLSLNHHQPSARVDNLKPRHNFFDNQQLQSYS